MTILACTCKCVLCVAAPRVRRVAWWGSGRLRDDDDVDLSGERLVVGSLGRESDGGQFGVDGSRRGLDKGQTLIVKHRLRNITHAP